MTIVYARRKLGRSKELGEQGKQSWREEFTIKSTVTAETRANLLAAMPAYGTLHAENPAAMCVKVGFTQHKDNPYLWDATAEWNTITGDRDPREDQKQPDERRPKWAFHFGPIQQFLMRDLDGLPFVDKAGTPFNPPPGVPVYVDEVTIRRYSATCNRTADRAYMNCTNSDAWLGAEAGTALIADCGAEEVFLLGAYWFAYTIKVLVSPRIVIGDQCAGGWNPLYILNAGPRELNTDVPPKPVPIVMAGYVDGQPHPLDANGKAILRKNDGSFASSPLFIAFRVVNSAAFGPLNLIPPWSW